MLLDLLYSLLVFLCVAGGLAWPLAARLDLAPAEKLAASATLSVLGAFLFGWIVYVFTLPAALLGTLPVLGAVGFVIGWRTLAAVLRDAEGRSLLAAQMIVTAWCVGWLALVASYSGGAWVGDWYGHLQRTWFFLERWPREIRFNGFDPLTSRPPLANVVNGALLVTIGRNFRHYQLASTLLGSLAFLPAALLARRWGGPRAIALAAVAFLVSPLFVQNAAFPWTKLPAAFFTLVALYFFLRAHDPAAPVGAGLLFAGGLAAGLLTHYSAGPYALVLAAAWLVLGFPHRHEIRWWRTTALAVLIGTLVLATWFGWALTVYGAHQTLLSHPTATDHAPTAGAQGVIFARNLRDTLVPHFLRGADFSDFVQASRAGWWRDWFFQLYQANFLPAFGSVAWAAILATLAADRRSAPARPRIFWATFVTGSLLLGIAAHATHDPFGLVQICLQPLVLLGLAYLAARWPALAPAWQRTVIAGAVFDLTCGIALSFAMQSGAFDPPGPVRPGMYSIFAHENLVAKQDNHWVFLADQASSAHTLVAIALSACLLLAVVRARRTPATAVR